MIIHVLSLIFIEVASYLHVYYLLRTTMVLVCMGGGGDHRGDGWAGGGPSNCLGLTRRVAVIYMFAAQDAYTAQTEDPEF